MKLELNKLNLNLHKNNNENNIEKSKGNTTKKLALVSLTSTNQNNTENNKSLSKNKIRNINEIKKIIMSDELKRISNNIEDRIRQVKSKLNSLSDSHKYISSFSLIKQLNDLSANNYSISLKKKYFIKRISNESLLQEKAKSCNFNSYDPAIEQVKKLNFYKHEKSFGENEILYLDLKTEKNESYSNEIVNKINFIQKKFSQIRSKEIENENNNSDNESIKETNLDNNNNKISLNKILQEISMKNENGKENSKKKSRKNLKIKEELVYNKNLVTKIIQENNVQVLNNFKTELSNFDDNHKENKYYIHDIFPDVNEKLRSTKTFRLSSLNLNVVSDFKNIENNNNNKNINNHSNSNLNEKTTKPNSINLNNIYQNKANEINLDYIQEKVELYKHNLNSPIKKQVKKILKNRVFHTNNNGDNNENYSKLKGKSIDFYYKDNGIKEKSKVKFNENNRLEYNTGKYLNDTVKHLSKIDNFTKEKTLNDQLHNFYKLLEEETNKLNSITTKLGEISLKIQECTQEIDVVNSKQKRDLLLYEQELKSQEIESPTQRNKIKVKKLKSSKGINLVMNENILKMQLQYKTKAEEREEIVYNFKREIFVFSYLRESLKIDSENVNKKINAIEEKINDIKDDLHLHYHKLLIEGKDTRDIGLSWIIQSIWSIGYDVIFSYLPKFLDDELIKHIFIISHKYIELQKVKESLNEIKELVKDYNGKKIRTKCHKKYFTKDQVSKFNKF